MRRILLKLVLTVMLLLTMCLRIPAFAGEAATVPLMEANDETMVDITENLIETLLLKSHYLDFYGASAEVLELGAALEKDLSGTYANAYVLPVNFDDLLTLFMEEAEADAMDVHKEDLRVLMNNHVGNAIVSMVNAPDVSYITFSSIMTVSSSYVADLDQETLVLLEYEGDFSIVADLYPSGEHVMTVNVSVIPTESISQITGMLSW